MPRPIPCRGYRHPLPIPPAGTEECMYYPVEKDLSGPGSVPGPDNLSSSGTRHLRPVFFLKSVSRLLSCPPCLSRGNAHSRRPSGGSRVLSVDLLPLGSIKFEGMCNKLKKSSWALVVLVAAVSIMPGLAWASCPGLDPILPGYDPDYYSLSKELTRSRYLVVGRVLSETWLGRDGKPKALQPPFQDGRPRPWGFDPYMGAVYEIEVLRIIKGQPGPQIALFSENSTARFWLDVGGEYLFFITEDTFDEPIGRRLTIDTCGNSASAADAKGVLERLIEGRQGNKR